MSSILQKTFQNHLFYKLIHFDYNFIEICSKGPINNKPAFVQIKDCYKAV